MGNRSGAFGSTGAQFRAAALFVSVLLLSAVGSAIDLTTFRTSYASVNASDVGLSGTSGFSSFQIAETAGHSFDAYLRPYWSWFSRVNSDRQYLHLDQNLGLDLDFYRRTKDGVPSAYNEFSADDWLSAVWDRYLGQTGLFIGLSSDLFPVANLKSRPDLGLFEFTSNLYGNVQLGIGYGHMRDAWPLAKAIRLLGILRDNDLIADEPRLGGVQAVADFISRSWRLFWVHDRSARFYYDSLETVLFANRIISHELPAWVLMKFDEDLMLGSDTREFGSRFFVGGIAGYNGEFDYRSIPGGTPTGNWSTMWAYLDPVLEYRFARPFGLHWTTDAKITDYVSCPADSLIHTLRLELNGAYEITNRLRADVGFGMNAVGRHTYWPFRDFRFSGDGGPFVGLDYYISDRLLLKSDLGYGFSYKPSGDKASSPGSLVRLSLSISAGPQWCSNRARGYLSR